MQPRIFTKVAHPAFIILVAATILLGSAGFAFADLPPDTKVFYYLHDHLGGIETVLDDKGAVVCQQDYLPYGTVRTEGCDDTEEAYGFTGKERDEETGLMYYGARYYDPAIGRFVSQDPWAGDLTDPQSLNEYSYARNNPVRYVDPDGKAYMDSAIWGMGVQYFKAKGYDISAHFLSHAINWGQIMPTRSDKPTTSNLYFNANYSDVMSQKIGNSIKKTNAYGKILGGISKDLESGLLNSNGKELSSIFLKKDNPDLHFAIKKFNYSFDAKKLKDGSFDVKISITDIYNFEKKELNSIIDFANNLAVGSQNIKAIQNFYIQIDLKENIKLEKKKQKTLSK